MSIDMKAAIADYKRRKVIGGIYAVTCVPTGERWVGAAPDLSTIKNRIWFSLGTGRSSWPELQTAWNAHGRDAFTFEEIDRLDDDLEPYAKELALKERLPQWKAELGAKAI